MKAIFPRFQGFYFFWNERNHQRSELGPSQIEIKKTTNIHYFTNSGYLNRSCNGPKLFLGPRIENWE